jgi:four helix bundle protein
MKVKTFEDLQVWQDSRNFVKAIYELTSLTQFNKDYGLKDQIQRASISIMNNISEGFERDSNREFIKFLGYSKGSAGEVRSMLYAALDSKYITKEEFELSYNNSVDIIKQLANFIKYLRTYSIKKNLNKVKNFILCLFN